VGAGDRGEAAGPRASTRPGAADVGDAGAAATVRAMRARRRRRWRCGRGGDGDDGAKIGQPASVSCAPRAGP
jgi:hypothetical protein